MGKLIHRTAPACTYFVTTKAWQSSAVFQATESAEILIECLLKYRSQGAYLLHEFVVMPNHLHLLLSPGEDASLEKAVQLIKGGSSHEIHQKRGHKMQIWQPGFHDWTVRDEADFQAKAAYTRQNPVEAHLVARPEDWPYSSASRKYILDEIPYRLLASGAKAPAL